MPTPCPPAPSFCTQERGLTGKLEPVSPPSPPHADPELELVPPRLSKEELIQNMDRVDREISMVEQQISKLKKKQVWAGPGGLGGHQCSGQAPHVGTLELGAPRQELWVPRQAQGILRKEHGAPRQELGPGLKKVRFRLRAMLGLWAGGQREEVRGQMVGGQEAEGRLLAGGRLSPALPPGLGVGWGPLRGTFPRLHLVTASLHLWASQLRPC